MRRAVTVITGIASCALLLFVVACGTAAPPPSAAGGVPEPMPAGVKIGPAALVGSTPLGGKCKALPDVAPTGPLPAPGHMPTGSTMAAIKQRGYLRVGVDQTTLYFGYRDSSGNLVGFDDAVAQQVAKAIFGDPNKIRYTVITSAERIPDVQHGVVDLVADNMTITCARLQLVAFSADYYNAGMTILVPTNSHVTDIGQLGGQRVCAAAGTTSINEVGRHTQLIPVSVPNWTDCLVMLQKGQVAAISTDNSVLVGLASQDPDIAMPKTSPFTCEPHGLAMSNAPQARDFVRFVNGVLAQMRTDGEWQRLYDQWVKPHLGKQVQPQPQYNVAVEQTCSWLP
ncbi:MAG TPA: glutamate ABC transporter substrate-binding protein [Trebonia sp.]|nr:glutamate ABC transporter substrate-binding protein [Trebonia sp.]